jgi:hypothetical protein
MPLELVRVNFRVAGALHVGSSQSRTTAEHRAVVSSPSLSLHSTPRLVVPSESVADFAHASDVVPLSAHEAMLEHAKATLHWPGALQTSGRVQLMFGGVLAPVCKTIRSRSGAKALSL